jgi:hypothetical protein
MFAKLPLISENGPSPQDFLPQGVVWHPSGFPWFLVSVEVLDHDGLDLYQDQVLMISTYDHLKEVLAQVSKLMRVKYIDYVTPGHMNGSGQWQIERLVEIVDLANDGGWSIPLCKVSDTRVYRELTLVPVSEFRNEQVIYRHGKVRKKKLRSV